MVGEKLLQKMHNLPLSRIYKPKIENYKLYKDSLSAKAGLEIGGPSGIFKRRNILPVYSIINTLDGCNYDYKTIWEGKIAHGAYLPNKVKYCGKQFISEATDLSFIESEKYDFILSSHCIEHIANPLKALVEWKRVLKTNGYFLLVVPHKEKTFDHNRSVTSMEHIIEDYYDEKKEDDLTHFDEILNFHDLSMDKRAGDFNSFKNRSMNNYENRCFHHHVFDTDLVVSLIDYLKLKIVSLDFAFPYHIICFAQKLGGNEQPDNSKYLGKYAIFRKVSPFVTDLMRDS